MDGKPVSCPAAATGDAAAPATSVQARAGKAAALHPPLRAVFMGTPDFAAVILKALLNSPQVQLLAVYTQPDRPAGRGQKLTPPPVKALALEHGLPVFQPLNFKSDPDGDAAYHELAALQPDVLIVAAYGLILPQRVLDIPRLMPINVHASLLPKYRGAAPIQRAIMEGESVTGVTIMRMEAGLDTGPMLMQRAVGIDINDTSATLHDELSHEGADLLLRALERLRAGALPAIAQEEARATHAAKLRKEESVLDFSLPPEKLHAQIRGLTPWPGAVMYLHRDGREPLAVHPAPGQFPLTGKMREACASALPQAQDRTAHILGLVDNALLIACGTGCYAFTSLRPAGKNSMDAAAFANGYLSGFSQAFFTDKPDTIALATPSKKS
ncbi:MAG: methionyl-tRNA formyltransferase [Desulfovibrionaceae bacterium]|nr:methionyl-tRNA formyltransferase [Desulfovibrionaceae bacterium]